VKSPPENGGAPVQQAEAHTQIRSQDENKDQGSAPLPPAGSTLLLERRLESLEAELAGLRRTVDCRRCRMDPPVPPRWYGDPHSRDDRPPHVCGLPLWSR